MEFDSVKDSGSRQEFGTGSVRDTCEGKGQPHLIAGEALSSAFSLPPYQDPQYEDKIQYLKDVEYNMLRYSEIVRCDREINSDLVLDSINIVIAYIKATDDGKYSTVMKRLSKHYENGGRKYSKNNWRKGQPISRYYDSAMRHLWAAMDSLLDEDHAAALLWNLIGIVQTKIDIGRAILPESLNDFPFMTKDIFPQENPNGN